MSRDVVVQLTWARPTAPAHAEAVLSPAEVRRLERLVRPSDRALFRSARILARRAVADALGVPLAEVDLQQRCQECGGPHGRPVAVVSAHRAPEVSVAYAAGIVVVALASRPVGVDVEPMDRAADGCTDVTLTASERAQLAAVAPDDRAEVALWWWVRKEAVLKALGVGLQVDPGQVEITAPGTAGWLVAWPGPTTAVRVTDVALVPRTALAVAVVGETEPTVTACEVDLAEGIS